LPSFRFDAAFRIATPYRSGRVRDADGL